MVEFILLSATGIQYNGAAPKRTPLDRPEKKFMNNFTELDLKCRLKKYTRFITIGTTVMSSDIHGRQHRDAIFIIGNGKAMLDVFLLIV